MKIKLLKYPENTTCYIIDIGNGMEIFVDYELDINRKIVLAFSNSMFVNFIENHMDIYELNYDNKIMKLLLENKLINQSEYLELLLMVK